MRCERVGHVKTLAALLLLATPAVAQQQQACGNYVEMAKNLKDKFSEQRVAMGLNQKGDAVVIFASPNGATWSALTVQPTGTACMVGAGSQWETIAPKPQGDPT